MRNLATTLSILGSFGLVKAHSGEMLTFFLICVCKTAPDTRRQIFFCSARQFGEINQYTGTGVYGTGWRHFAPRADISSRHVEMHAHTHRRTHSCHIAGQLQSCPPSTHTYVRLTVNLPSLSLSHTVLTLSHILSCNYIFYIFFSWVLKMTLIIRKYLSRATYSVFYFMLK